MAKYTAKKSKNSSGSILMLRIVWSALCVACGYWLATTDTCRQLTAWVNAQVFASVPVQKHSSIIAPVVSAKLPAPKFEFYTLLTQNTQHEAVAPLPQTGAEMGKATHGAVDKVVDPELSNLAASHLKSATSVAQAGRVERYVLQLASFQHVQDAERMKASLTLNGFRVAITPVRQHNAMWYRVILGPFTNRAEAQRAQGAVASMQRIMGIIRKMDA